MSKAAFVLVHGAWHNHHTWDLLVPLLEANGHSVVTLDLPGAGVNAAIPESFKQRPLDSAAFATEPSPNAGVTQDERTTAVIAAVRDAATKGDGRVVLVGHSLGGLTISPVTESVPDEIAAVVYLTAFLVPPSGNAGDVIAGDVAGPSKVLPLLLADPAQVGALRMDVGSPDAAYQAAVKDVFYGDLTSDQFAFALSHLHPDEPAQVVGVVSPITADRFGRVSRHYIRCAQDQAIFAAVQDHMVNATDTALGGTTTVHRMDTSHSPFFSDPAGLARILEAIAC